MANDKTGDAQQTIERFWKVQDSGDYTQLPALFAEDALIEDPVYGRFEGREAIVGFMTKMVEEMGKLDMRFEVDEISGDEHTAWARWTAISPKGRRGGVGIYKVRDGKLTYYRDYMDPEEGAPD